jgi:DNA-binding NtrC family response regulator
MLAAMDGVRTKLQPRQTRMVRRLRVRVDEGLDAGAVSEEDGASIAIGTSADNQLVLRDPTVSRYHLEVRRTDDGIAIADLGSSNGTWAVGLRLERAVVASGTRLRIGDTTITVEDAGSTLAPAGGAEPPRAPGLVGDSEAIKDVSRLVHRLARVDSSVLIQGETGVGKEVVARAIHEASPRRDNELVVVDCGSMPATLVASLLFGHEKGAFTGADARRVGAFERAAGGTVLLDEIGELPLEVQPALLGVLERRTFTRVGGAQTIATDVRVLAATHRDLRAEVNAGRFRADLYYRLAVARVVIPPLRERPEDVEPLVRHFVERLTGAPDHAILGDVLDALRAHPWSGNVRELRNVVESALVMGEVALAGDRGEVARIPTSSGEPGEVAPYRDARARALHKFEAEYLRALIDRCGGNASEAARRARMDRPYLLTLLRKHGLRS